MPCFTLSLSIFPLKQSPNVEITSWTMIINKLHWVCKATFSGFILEIGQWGSSEFPSVIYGALFQERGSKKRGHPIGTYLCRLFREKGTFVDDLPPFWNILGKLKKPWLQLLPNAGCLSGEIIGSLSNYDDDDDDDDDDDVFCTCIMLFSTFLWRPLHDYDVKPPNLTLYGGRGHTTTNFPSSFWTWI